MGYHAKILIECPATAGSVHIAGLLPCISPLWTLPRNAQHGGQAGAESGNMKKKHFWVCFALLLFWILFIFARSAQPNAVSTQESESVRQPLSEIVHSPLSSVFVRKLAHFTEFSVLGVLAVLLFTILRQRIPRTFLYAGMLGLSVAFCDETIQLFVPGRAGLLTDVWIDTAGVIVGASLALGVRLLLRYCRARKRYDARR